MASKKHIFTQVEKKIFMDILKSYANVIENKNTDSASLREKNQTWDKITREYNASPHVTSEVSNKQLRRLWMNLKQRQREALTRERQHRMATGGGPSTSGADIDPDVALIAPALMVENPGAIDSDDIFQESSSMDIDDTQAVDIQQPSTSSAIQIQPDLSPVPSPTTTTPQPPLIVTIPPPRTITTPPPPRSTTTPPPRISTTPPPPSNVFTPLPPLPPPSTSTSFQLRRQNILEKEYTDRFNRAAEIHALERELLGYKIREAKAKAELAELILQRERLQREDTE